jgi:WXXGXW repeat (2 copies)
VSAFADDGQQPSELTDTSLLHHLIPTSRWLSQIVDNAVTSGKFIMSAHLRNRWPGRASTHGRAHACGALAARQLAALALALLAALLLLLSRAAYGDVALTVNVAPPPLPVYEQPPLPAPGYLWVPGYWAWGAEGYFWVPGTWVLPPDPDLVWTPGYWGWADDAYVWYPGYWGPQVGFYGGIDYGFGYFGHGYEGGYWRDHQFWYNRAATNIGNTNVTNVYNRTVNNVTVNNISYNGPNGVRARATPEEQAAAREPRHAPSREQTAHVTEAGRRHELLASVNQGRPPVAATPKPGAFSGPGVMPTGTAGHGAAREVPSSAARTGHATGATGATASRSEAQPKSEATGSPPSEPPRRLAQAPAQTAPPPTHEHPGPAERAAPPPEHASPRAEQPQHPNRQPNGRPEDQPPPRE